MDASRVRKMRREFMLGSAAAAVLHPLRALAYVARSRAIVGAIRWDPWYILTDSGARVDMEHTLGPAKWHGRAPSCATAPSKDKLDLGRCGTQARLDMELILASDAHLDYWAYVWYGSQHDLQSAWRLHQSSRFGANVKWCKIYASYSGFAKDVDGNTDECVFHLKQPGYQCVEGVRPLIFLLPDSLALRDLAACVQVLRDRCQKNRAGDPYVVLLTGAQQGVVAQAGADAIGVYSKAWTAPVAGSYSELDVAVGNYWASMRETMQAVIPTAVTGADRRPRIERPVPWEAKDQKPGVDDDHFYYEGTPAQIADHVGRMLSWIRGNPSACPAQTGLIYSWDEHDEGGSTLNPSIGAHRATLDAVRRALSRPR